MDSSLFFDWRLMMIKKGDKIQVEYEGTFDTGEVFDSSSHGDHSHPLAFEVGSGQVIKGFDTAVLGMKKGQEKDITLKPEEAYGQRHPQAIQKIPRDRLPTEPEPQKGMMLTVGTPDGRKFPAKIIDATSHEVTLDMNHPLAGKTLHFHIKIVRINE